MISGPRIYTPPPETLIPWFTILLVTFAFFIALHDPARSQSIGDDYLPDQETIEKNVSEGNSKRQIGFLAVGGYGLLTMLFPYRRKVQPTGILAVLVVFFLAWMVLSVLWAVDKPITVRRLIVIAILSIGSLAMACRMSLRDLVLFVLVSSLIYLLIGIASEVVYGGFQFSREAYRFTGTIHPNNQGINCSLLVLAAVSLAHMSPKWRVAMIACAILGFVFLILTKSRTSMAGAVAASVVYLFLAYRKSPKALMLGSWAITVLLSALFFMQENMLSVINKVVLLGRADQDISGAKNLTGRLPLWEQLMEYAAERPIQGYGYGSFFTIEHIEEIAARQGWAIAECHSVFLEVLMGTGAVGLVTYIVIQIIAMVRATSYYKYTGDHGYLFMLGLIAFGFVGGLAESTLLVPTMQTFLHFIAVGYLAFQPPPAGMPTRQRRPLFDNAARGSRPDVSKSGAGNAPSGWHEGHSL